MCHANGLQFGPQSQTASLPPSPVCIGGSQGSLRYLLQNREEERFLRQYQLFALIPWMRKAIISLSIQHHDKTEKWM